MENGEETMRHRQKAEKQKSIGQYELGRNEADAVCVKSVNVAWKSNENSNENSETRGKKPEGARLEGSERNKQEENTTPILERPDSQTAQNRRVKK